LTQNSRRIAAFLKSETPSETQAKIVYGVIRKVIDPVLKIHELLVLLPRETAEPQVFFMLGDCFGRKGRRLPASVILTNLLSSYEYRVEDVLRTEMSQQELPDLKAALQGFKPGGSVLGLAFADRDNPLSWAVLAHEYGHAIDDTRDIAYQIVHGKKPTAGRTADDWNLKVKWTSEVFADFVAARVLGPASLIPILFVEMARARLNNPPAGRQFLSHPPTPVRLRLTREYLAAMHVSTADFEEVFEVYEFDYARKLRALGRKEKDNKERNREAAEALLLPLISKIASSVNSLRVQPFSENNADRAKTLQRKLQLGLPVSSVRQSTDREILARLNSLSDKSSTRKVYTALRELNELPATSSEIIAAGWLYKLSSLRDCLLQSFPGQRASLGVYGEYLERTDALLLKSLELAAVQAEMSLPAGSRKDAPFGN